MWLDKLAIQSSKGVAVPVMAGAYATLFLGHLVKGARRIPTLSIVMFVGLIAANLLFWIWAWHFGIQWQGPLYTISVALENVALVVVAALVLRRGRRVESFWSNYSFHTLLALWLCWVSCPWLGEMP